MNNVYYQVAEGVDISAVTPSIGLSLGATIPSYPTDFTTGVKAVTVTAADGVTQKNWNLIVYRSLYDTRGAGYLYKFIKID